MDTLKTLQQQLNGFWSDKPVQKAYLFGSAAREELRPESDIDILVELDQTKTNGMIEYIKMIEALENLLSRKVDLVTTDGLSRFIKPAIDRQLEIIGEATAAISSDTKLKYPEIEWQPIKQFRNIIAHEYFGVSTQIVWGVVKKELPGLKIQIQRVIDQLEK
jgi:uncharacterized protein with HEPN domain